MITQIMIDALANQISRVQQDRGPHWRTVVENLQTTMRKYRIELTTQEALVARAEATRLDVLAEADPLFKWEAGRMHARARSLAQWVATA